MNHAAYEPIQLDGSKVACTKDVTRLNSIPEAK